MSRGCRRRRRVGAPVELAPDQPDRDRGGEQERRRAGVEPPAAATRSRYQPETVHISFREPRGLRAGGGAKVLASPRGRHRSPSATRSTSALAGPLVNARSRSAGLRTLGADTGKQQDRLRHQLPRLADRPRMGRADDRADRREPALADEVGAPVGHERGDVAATTGRPSESVMSWTSPPAFEVLTMQKMPLPLRRAAARYGSIDSRPSQGFTVSASASGSSPSR